VPSVETFLVEVGVAGWVLDALGVEEGALELEGFGVLTGALELDGLGVLTGALELELAPPLEPQLPKALWQPVPQ